MEQRITAEDMRSMLISVCDVIVENEPYLTEIDNQSGDGDHGIGMKRGFSMLGEYLRQNSFLTVNDLFHSCGLELIKTMGGASGVLFGTLFTGGLMDMPQLGSVDLKQFSAMVSQASHSIMRRGRTKPGDKTMVDALEPAANTLLCCAGKDMDFCDALQEAAKASKQGMMDTANMVAKKGRARQYGEKSIGCYDAGAVSISLIFGELANWAKDNKAIFNKLS